MGDSIREHLLGEIKKRHERAQEILGTAEREVRDLNEEERSEFEALTKRIEEHKLEVKRIEDREDMKRKLEALGAVSEIATQEVKEVPARNIGEALTKSVDYQAVIEQARKEGMPKFTLPTFEVKAPGDPVLESGGTNQDAIAPTWDPRLFTPGLVQYPLRIVDVLNITQVGMGNTVNYPIAITRTPPVDTETAEGDAKPGAEFGFDFVTQQLVKHAAFGGASEEMFQDAPVLSSYVNTQLGLMALQGEEADIANALYTASITSADGTGVSGSPIDYDAVLEAMTLVRIAGGEPNAVLLHPNDWARLAASRSVAGDGGYFSGGPYRPPAQGLWGSLREVQTTAVPEGTGLVGDFVRGATLYRKGGLRVDTSNSHDDWFQKNLIAIRAEIRSILGVHYPEFFTEVVFSS